MTGTMGPKPALPVLHLDNIPPEFRAQRRFLGWGYVWVDGKWTKPPFDLNRSRPDKLIHGDSQTPATWTDFKSAVTALETISGLGLGWAPLGSEFVGLDFDNCLDADGQPLAEAVEYIDEVISYTETSPSGRGLRTWARATLPEGRRASKKAPWGDHFSFSNGNLYLTLTGNIYAGRNEIRACQDAVDRLHAKMFPKAKAATNGGKRRAPSTDYVPSNFEVLEKACGAKNGAKVRALYHSCGDDVGYDSRSEAALALADLLAFYVVDEDQLYRLLADSANERLKTEADIKRCVDKAMMDRTERYPWKAPETNVRHLSAVKVPTEEGESPSSPIELRTTAELIVEVGKVVDRFIVLPSRAAALYVALWVLHTWVFEAFEATPYLIVDSPVKHAGKTTMLRVLKLIVRKAWTAVGTTEAVLFRKIELERPTLLLDECDLLFAANADRTNPITAILNAGNEMGTTVPRMVGEGKKMEPKDFEVFSPKVLTGINAKKWPDTVVDRSIPLTLKRKKKNEKPERLRVRKVRPEMAPLRQQLERWAQEHVAELRNAWPELPEQLNDRAADSWEPLLAIADVADRENGGSLGVNARKAAIKLSAGSDPDEDAHGIAALAGIQRAFDHIDKPQALSTATITTKLNEGPRSAV